MSRSRIDWGKGGRNEKVRNSYNFVDAASVADGMPLSLSQKIEGEKLKPFLIEFVRSLKPGTEIWGSVYKLIQSSEVRVFAHETREDKTVWCECEMLFHKNWEANVELDPFCFLLEKFAERYEHEGSDWILFFWFRYPESLVRV